MGIHQVYPSVIFFRFCGRMRGNMTTISKNQWKEILDNACRDHGITAISRETWLNSLHVSSVDNDTVYLTVNMENASMAIHYIEKKYKMILRTSISEYFNKLYNVEFLTPEEEKKSGIKAKNEVGYNYEAANLNLKYTFDTFVEGNNNRFARNAALAVAESPGEIYNPLFLYGNSGLGKTHLMHSIGHFILSQHPDAKVLYVTSEVFTNELISCLRSGSGNTGPMTEFREKYRNIDVLLIDDIQFIIGKESTQLEFFNTLNHLHLNKKHIVITSDKPPKEFVELEERFRTRFEMGLIAEIDSPDYETRMAILENKAEQEGYNIDRRVLEYIADNLKSNIRELEGALNKLIAFQNLGNGAITLEIAERELKSIIFPDAPRKVTPELILQVVCEHYNIDTESIRSSRRNADIVLPRQIIMYLSRTMTDAPHQYIAKMLNKKDHTTIIHGYERIKNDIKNDANLQKTIDIIKKKINPV